MPCGIHVIIILWKTKKIRVLIVDDMRINRIVLASILATHGIASDQAESGMECIELCRENDYDLVLLDHRMPELDGVDTLVRLKEMFSVRGRDVPIICHTTEEGRSNVNLYKAAGFADVLIKPVDPRELFDVIMVYLKDEGYSSGVEDDASYTSVLSDGQLETGENPENSDFDIKKEIEKNLTEAKFNVVTIPDEPDRIIAARNEADIVIYSPGTNDASNIGITMNLLGEICQDDSKILCLTGEITDINKAMASNGSHRVSKTYPRPLDIGTFVNDMVFFTELEADFHRKRPSL